MHDIMSHVLRNLFMPYGNKKGADQPAHLRIYAVWSVPLLFANTSSFYIWNFKPVAEQAGLSLPWSQTPKNRFSRDKAHMAAHYHCTSNL